MSLGGSLAGSLAGSFGASLAGGGTATAASILGGAYALDYDARTGYWTPGTPPDVASGENQGLHPNADISQAAALDRPHGETVAGLEAWTLDGDSPPDCRLENLSVPTDFYDVGDAVSLITVFKLDSTSTNRNIFQTAENNVWLSRGFRIWYTGGNIAGRVVDGATHAEMSTAFSDTSSWHVVRVTHTGSTDLRKSFHLDGVEIAESAVGAQSRYGDGVLFGKDYVGTPPIYGSVARNLVAVGADEARLVALTTHLMDLYGIS